MIEYVDIIFGAQWGDEGKGKISNAISKNYDIVCRWNGGPNAGHTVYINEKKYKKTVFRKKNLVLTSLATCSCHKPENTFGI